MPITKNWSSFTQQTSQDSRYLAQVTGSSIKIFDLVSGELKKTLEVAEGFMPLGIWFTPDNKQLITVSNNSLTGSDQTKKIDVMRLATFAQHFKIKENNFNQGRSSDQDTGMVNIFDINLEAPQVEKNTGWGSWLW